MAKSKYAYKKTEKGKPVQKPRRWKNKNGRLTPGAKRYLSYKVSQGKKEKQLESKGMMTSGMARTSDKFVRIIYRWESKTRKAHSPIEIRAFIDGLEEDKYKLRDRVLEDVSKLYGSASEEGKFYEEEIDSIQFHTTQISERRYGNEPFKKRH